MHNNGAASCRGWNLTTKFVLPLVILFVILVTIAIIATAVMNKSEETMMMNASVTSHVPQWASLTPPVTSATQSITPTNPLSTWTGQMSSSIVSASITPERQTLSTKRTTNSVSETIWSAQSFLQQSTLLSIIPGSGYIPGITVLGSELFVIRSFSTLVDVHNTNNLTLTRTLPIAGSTELRAIVASPRHNCLFISDVQQKVVYRYDLSNNVITKWGVGEGCYGLSMTSNDNVLATLFNTRQVREYTPDGDSIRVISPDRTIESPYHSVQLPSDRFLVCHTGELHRVCIIDASGRIIQCYGGASGLGIGQFNGPQNLAVDKHGYVLVADRDNNRVVLLSPSLTHIGYVYMGGNQLSGPSTLHLDELNRRFYIGERTSTGRVFVLTA